MCERSEINMNEVVIRPITLEDTEDIVRWRNIPSVKKNLYTQTDLTVDQHIHYYNTIVKSGKCEQFIIQVETGGQIINIGTVFLKNIDYHNKSGEYGIFIGDEKSRGKGYAKQATELILNYGFESLQLHRIYLSVMADNYPAIKAYESVGFKQEGIERDGFLRNSGYVDIILMAILDDEWKRRKEEKKLSSID